MFYIPLVDHSAGCEGVMGKTTMRQRGASWVGTAFGRRRRKNVSEAERHWTGVEKWSVGTGGIGERREPRGMCAVSPPLCLIGSF